MKKRKQDQSMEQKGKGVLKKISGKWTPVIVAGGLFVGGAALLSNDAVMAQANTAVVSVMSTMQSSDFDSKDTLSEQRVIQNESQIAMEKITADWHVNSVEEVQAEIERQTEAGLDTYVVQWGDTLNVLSEATGKSVDQISEENNIGNIDLILTGDILTGILDVHIEEHTEISAEETTQESTTDTEADVVENNESDATEDEETEDTETTDVEPTAVEDPIEGTPAPTSDDKTAKPVLNGDDLPNADENPSDDADAENDNADDSMSEVGVTKTYQDISDIKPGVRYLEDEELPVGETVVDDEGTAGQLVVTFTETLQENGDIAREEISREETPAEDRVIRVGTQEAEEEEAVEPTTSTTKHETVQPYKSTTVETDDLPEGETQVDQEGIDGKVIETIEVTEENGDEVNREVIHSEVLQEAQDEIILVGTGAVAPEPEPEEPEEEVTEETVTEPVEIPYETETVSTADLPEGESEIVQAGVNGLNEAHYAVTLVDGVETNRELIEEIIIQEPVDEIVHVGTAAPEEEANMTVRTETTSAAIPFETETTENPEVAAGTETVIQEGQEGLREITDEVTYENGEEVNRELSSDVVVQEPVNQIVEVGTKQVETVTETATEAIEYGTETVNNNQLAQGEERVTQEGQAGIRTITYEVTYENGEETNRQIVSNDVTQAPVNETIEIGTAAPETADHPEVYNVDYTVQHGDTLYDVATGFGSTVAAVREANNLTSNLLHTGDDLVIPVAEVVPMDIPQSYDNRQVIMIDPGHGGSDGGAVGSSNQEADINLEISNRIVDQLIRRGYEVIMTRDGDISLSLMNRSQQANASDADLFISVHQNAFNGSANGIETFYYNYSENYPSSINEDYHNDEQRIANSKYLADLVQDRLINDTGANDRGVKNETFAILRETEVPAILIETGFIDNRAEEASLSSPEYQETIANAIAEAVDEYFSTVG